MNDSMTKRVRMNGELLELLAMVAQKNDITESEVLRRGVQLQVNMIKRKENMHRLLQAADDIPGDDVKWSLDP